MNTILLNLRQRAKNLLIADSSAKFSIDPSTLICLIDECESKDTKITLLEGELLLIKSKCILEVKGWIELLNLDHQNKHSDPLVQKELDREHGNVIRLLNGIARNLEKMK